jgi:FixJ family two-component response regulator
MPVVGGLELLDTLDRENWPVPIIVMTGNADEQTTSRALAGGAVALLEKPFDVDKLIDAIEATRR